MVNVISFCLYGDVAKYTLGMKENVRIGLIHFPDWEIRVYHNTSVPSSFIDEYTELGAKCILCENIGTDMNWEGMFWRFFPLDDSSVDYWISRDADSRISPREYKMIEEWIESGKTLHCIRDHRCHCHAIMGGMFGIRNKTFHDNYTFDKISDIIKRLYCTYKERKYNVDQVFLNGLVWRTLRNDSISHISNGGRRIYESDIEVPSVHDFVGKQYRINYPS